MRLPIPGALISNQLPTCKLGLLPVEKEVVRIFSEYREGLAPFVPTASAVSQSRLAKARSILR